MRTFRCSQPGQALSALPLRRMQSRFVELAFDAVTACSGHGIRQLDFDSRAFVMTTRGDGAAANGRTSQ
jgi:hypothetical protein